jgi:WD40 repeat protein
VSDRSIRIWNNRDRAEIAKLMHNCPVVSVLWMEGDSGIISLGEDGLVSKWTRNVSNAWCISSGFTFTLVEYQGNNRWEWAKVLDAGNEHREDDGQICFAYHRDRIAVSFPRIGVKVWMCVKGWF